MVRKPLLVVLALVAVVGGYVLLTRGGDDKSTKPTAAKPAATTGGTPTPPRAISKAELKRLQAISMVGRPGMTHKQAKKVIGSAKLVSRQRRGPESRELYRLKSGVYVEAVFVRNRLMMPFRIMPPGSQPPTAPGTTPPGPPTPAP